MKIYFNATFSKQNLKEKRITRLNVRIIRHQTYICALYLGLIEKVCQKQKRCIIVQACKYKEK